MINSNKRGQQQAVIPGIFLGVVLIFIAAIAIVAYQQGGWNSIPSATDSVSSAFMGVVGPLFNALLGLDSAGNNAFLMVLVFILISIIIVGTLDSFNMFGEDGKGKLTNFLIGIIVAIIGVRFMPQNLWASLTAPSSAFVATLLVGLPFFALVFVTMKVKSLLASKLLWLFFLVTTIVLIFKSAGEFIWIYLIFAVLAVIMMFFDSTVRKFFYKEKGKADVETAKANIDLIARKALRDEITELEKIITNSNSPKPDITAAKKRIAVLKAQYAEAAKD